MSYRLAGFTGTTIALISFQLTLKGLALYLEKTVPEAKARGVAIGYDGRFNSLTFAKYTAATFLHLGFNVFFFPTIVPTPLTSFAVLGENCVASVMITASHNPKDDNGYKVYWENSAQVSRNQFERSNHKPFSQAGAVDKCSGKERMDSSFILMQLHPIPSALGN